MSGAVSPLPDMSSWSGQGQLYLLHPFHRFLPPSIQFIIHDYNIRRYKLLGTETTHSLKATNSGIKVHTQLRDITYLLTPLSTVLLDRLTGSQLVKKFPAFYGTRGFITAFTSARNPSLS